MASTSEPKCFNAHEHWQWTSLGAGPPAELNCPECLAAYEEARQKALEYEQTQASARWANLCPPDYREVDLARLPDREAYEKVLEWQYGPQGLLAHGKARQGKTRAVWQLVKRLLFEGHAVAAFNCVSFGHKVMEYGGNPAQFVAWIESLHKVVPVVYLDDPFGKGKLTERAIAELFGLVENRMANRLPILITMNMTAKQIAAYIGGDRATPLVGRLMECCESIAFTAKDEPLQAKIAELRGPHK